ncbi:MAG: tetratricopeptide repeat protein [Tepidisphaeraceae bacterium]
MSMSIRASYIIAAVLGAAMICRGTVLTTTDGERLEGEVKRSDKGWSVTLANGDVKTIEPDRVKSIEASRDPADVSNALEGLQSLRRSVDFSNDLPRIIERYERFVSQTTDPAVRDEAKKDLALWRQRRDQGLIKVGKNWVTKEQADQIAKDNLQAIDDARAAMKGGQTTQAQALVNTLLGQDSENVSALYLLGVIQAQQNNLIEARKTFTHLQQAIPNHSPTSYDLAVILAKQKQWGPACGAMEQALAATPGVRFLLDATAELLHLIPPERRHITAAQRLSKLFFAQDAVLQKQMAAQKLYRWGAGWVDQATHDKLQQQIADTEQKIKDLQADFDKSQARLNAIDQQTSANDATLRQIEAHSFVVMPDGTTIHTPYPQAYFDLKSQNVQLRNERIDVGTRIDALRLSARQTRAQLPQPTYSGVLTLIEEDGVPVVGAPPPPKPPAAVPRDQASEPATAPSGPVIRIGPADTGG